jgi:predicted neuraminidase
MCYIATLLAVLLLSRTTAGNDTNDFDGVVRPDKDGTYSAYMIPPYETNHASTIEQLPDGTLLAAWFSGRHEEANRLAIVFARLPAGSKQWTNATTVSVQDGYANQNPVLFYDHAANVIRLFHSHAKAESGESKSVIYHLESSDNGTTWSTPTLFKPGSFSGAFPRNRIIPALDGGLIFPIYNAATNTAMMVKS